INHYAGLQINPNGIHIDYVLDMAEIPAFQAIRQVDRNQDRQTDPTESAAYAAETCGQLAPQLVVQAGAAGIPLAVEQAAVEYPPGVAGLATLRLSCHYKGSLPLGRDNLTVEFADHTYEHRLGWREITLVSDGIPMQSQIRSDSISQALRQYPEALLNSPPDQRRVSFVLNPTTLEPIAPVVAGFNSASEQTPLAGRANDRFTRLITLEHLDPVTMAVALLIAFVWGGFHALTPGHGKTAVGAYLVGSRGTARHALILGLTTTLTHMAGVFALGLVALLASQSALSEQIYPWLSMVSGVLVVAIGLSLFWQRWRGKMEHSHAHPHSHDHSHSHDHDLATQGAEHHHEPHSHELHSHDPHHPHAHSHFHALPEGSRLTWTGVLALGISGGLLPCPSALVVLLSAVALGRVGFGLALIFAFSLGLAAVLTGIGLILIYAKTWFAGIPTRLPRLAQLSSVSALLIACIGIGMTYQALVQMGLI
ncbi:MAG: sulfite exporter TauE/SafE family protein, partial [Thermostichus sp. BF3_bins_97]